MHTTFNVLIPFFAKHSYLKQSYRTNTVEPRSAQPTAPFRSHLPCLLVDGPYWLPLVPRLERRELALLEVSLQFGVVVPGAVRPRVVGNLMVIPYGDHGGGGSQGLEAGFTPV